MVSRVFGVRIIENERLFWSRVGGFEHPYGGRFRDLVQLPRSCLLGYNL